MHTPVTRCVICDQVLAEPSEPCPACSPPLGAEVEGAFSDPGLMRISPDLFLRFPEMKPIRNPVGLATVSGCGVVAWGARDYDEASTTFVKTTFLIIALVPVLALASYRVARAGRGWFFVGQVPLSLTARILNVVSASCIAGLLASWLWQ